MRAERARCGGGGDDHDLAQGTRHQVHQIHDATFLHQLLSQPSTPPMATPPTYCQTCSSELRPTEERYVPPCCNVPICGACIARNPRLKAYAPCLRCGDVRTREGAAEVARGALRREEDRRKGEEVFVLEDSDEEGDEATLADEFARPTQTQAVAAQADTAPAAAEAEAQPRVVEIKHLVSRGDTLQSIARKYATDVSRVSAFPLPILAPFFPRCGQADTSGPSRTPS